MKQTIKSETMGIEKLFEIKINSSSQNKDLGFAVLRRSNLPILCLEEEKYVIPESAIKLLKDGGVRYTILKVNGVEYIGPKTKS